MDKDPCSHHPKVYRIASRDRHAVGIIEEEIIEYANKWCGK